MTTPEDDAIAEWLRHCQVLGEDMDTMVRRWMRDPPAPHRIIVLPPEAIAPIVSAVPLPPEVVTHSFDADPDVVVASVTGAFWTWRCACGATSRESGESDGLFDTADAARTAFLTHAYGVPWPGPTPAALTAPPVPWWIRVLACAPLMGLLIPVLPLLLLPGFFAWGVPLVVDLLFELVCVPIMLTVCDWADDRVRRAETTPAPPAAG